MKTLVTIILILANVAHAKIDFSNYKMSDLSAFAKKNLNEKTDLEEVKDHLKFILQLDSEDPSRTGVFILSESYEKNKALYDRAFKEIETKKNKKQLNEIKSIMANFNKDGNG